MNPEKIGQAIKTLRLKAGYTQNGIAGILGVTDKAVSKWERGLSVPDISIVTKLALLLNIDVDNLLDGNIVYLEKNWQGLLILKENETFFAGTEIYGKPLVYIFLSYFMLAGIRHIYIKCPVQDKEWIKKRLDDGNKLGITIEFLTNEDNIPSAIDNTMVVYNNPFVYGPNLTKYFQRAMSRQNGISILTVVKNMHDNEKWVLYDNNHQVLADSTDSDKNRQVCVPILFFPKKFFSKMEQIEHIEELRPLYAEPMGNGMIEYLVSDDESMWDTSTFLRYMKNRMGKDIYNLNEIAHNRNLLKQNS